MSELLGPDGQPVMNTKEVIVRLHQQDELLLQLLQQTRFDSLQTQLKTGFLIKLLSEAKLLPTDLEDQWKVFANSELEKLKKQEEQHQQEQVDL